MQSDSKTEKWSLVLKDLSLCRRDREFITIATLRRGTEVQRNTALLMAYLLFSSHGWKHVTVLILKTTTVK